MDFATLFGIIGGFGLVIAAILVDGAGSTFVNVPSIMIVVGGTLASILVTFPMEEVLQAVSGGMRALLGRKQDPEKVVDTMVRLAELSRRKGLLALENVKTENHVLKKACQLISDNAGPQVIETVLHLEIAAMKRRHNIPIAVFQRLGLYAPAFGMIGTLIGLVQMLVNLHDPKSVGPGMAVALLTTFYGALLAYVVFLPLAGKLAARSKQEELALLIVFEGVRCILENNNPRIVYDTLSSFIALKERRIG